MPASLQSVRSEPCVQCRNPVPACRSTFRDAHSRTTISFFSAAQLTDLDGVDEVGGAVLGGGRLDAVPEVHHVVPITCKRSSAAR
eukprot:3254774-Rhodomonas_salina.4